MATTKRATLHAGKKPKLGQNFLANPQAAERIVDALGDISQTVAVEIGPGKGALTEALARRAGRLIAIELDRMLATQLRYNYGRQPNVEIIEADVLKLDFRTILNRTIGPLNDLRPLKPARARVVGNLPYYITSDILLRLFDFHDQFDLIVLMVQREVADRIAAEPGSRDYGLLSATAQLYTRVEKLFTLPPGAFSPPPKVHSSVLRMTVAPRFEELQVNPQEFIGFLKRAFAMKRKTLFNNLREKYGKEKIRTALKEAGVRADIRAEALPLVKSSEIFRRLITN
ncbi:MAG TPA: 16S rRNA (adenine(1518)-N(6)/adenine(1519)-N(6))-dimethyltransferase RsmA [Candidatus Sulfotelmatobacter sp.]|jgi:16S rRNA (adenine1518-N6/adenine1519-N6)-dimethyltransferase|nr:16S rRNA (adenine(1518)-N(6)/adenine(1519)-N(6))-dimethyltransferase RsmA [Candidatus Sulfotelmatobacter sp.]